MKILINNIFGCGCGCGCGFGCRSAHV